jgi:hypothetical protein
MNKILSNCPVCAGQLHPTELGCNSCGTKIQSEFDSCRFCGLNQEQLQFVTMFLRNRGNITAVGDEMDISYPTVTRRLDAVLSALGLTSGGLPAAPTMQAAPVSPPPPPMPSPEEQERRDAYRRRILEMLDQGDITAEEATKQLKDL